MRPYGGPSLRRSVPNKVLTVLAVANAVLTILTCLSINPFDLGCRGDCIMCQMCLVIIYHVKVSEANGCPLYVNYHLGGCIAKIVLETLYGFCGLGSGFEYKWVFVECTADKQVLFTIKCEEICH